jgi:hypothetical protein
MSTPASIVAAIQDVLQASSYLSYINNEDILLGIREGVTIFPCILIEPISDILTAESYPYEQRTISVNITAYVQVYDKDKQLVGDTNTKGVLDVENDIRKALSSDITLGLADVYDTRIISSIHDFEQYPTRGFAINVECHYRQNRLTRA